MGIFKAWWHTQSCAGVLFERDLQQLPEIFLESGGEKIECSARYATGPEFAAYTSYYIEGGFVHFFLNSVNFHNVARHGRGEFYLCGNFNGWGEAVGKEEWKLKRGAGEFEYELSVPASKFTDLRKKFLFKFANAQGRWFHPRGDAPNLEYDAEGNANLRFLFSRTRKNFVLLQSPHACDLREESYVECGGRKILIEAAKLLLESNYDSKMGVSFSDGGTHFKLFAPRADKVKLLLRDLPSDTPTAHDMQTFDGALWRLDFSEDLSGKFYTYKVLGRNLNSSVCFDPDKEIIDPYAELLTGRDGVAKIVNPAHAPRAKVPFEPPHWQDLSIMEIHVRDVLKNAPAWIAEREKLGFKGITKWLKSDDCYLLKARANAVELQPIQEFDNKNIGDYHWGYMPVNWFAPASAYASEFMSQAEDFAEMVDAFHERKIAVILDVVYNHVGEPNHLLHIDKQYYFNTTKDNNLINFSGCGNDFRAGAPMSKKLIIDSLKHFVSRYNVDGFRFDLAELLGADVLSEIEFELKKIKPGIILIAEPWSFRGNISGALYDTGFSYWNDGFREFMLSYAKGAGNFEGFCYYIAGSQNFYASWPAQTVNYVESHDDHCLLDRISSTPETPNVSEIKTYKMCVALVLSSIGIPMMAEGADLLRTKKGENNTYLRGDLNALDYARGAEYTGLRSWVRAFMDFRLGEKSKALRLENRYSKSYIKFFKSEKTSAAGALFNADNSIGARRIFAAFNPSAEFVSLPLDGLDLSAFEQIADISRFDQNGISEGNFFDKNSIVLPPKSFALFAGK
ncbi:MAG: glycoside hydrolase family 1 [Opitutales bacterium]|nr:glycoside hydrolase family 1 [Opitutales bacterium]